MPLTERDRRLYARQLLLTEIGERGQERLLGSRVELADSADPRAAAAAERSLVRAGVSVSRGAPRAVACVDAGGVERVAGQALLDEAAALFCGAFAAVEALKALIDVGKPATLPAQWTLTAEDP